MQSPWILSFTDKVVKACGHNEVIAAHINIPRSLPISAYYTLSFPHPFDGMAIYWVWRYINGLGISSNLHRNSYLPAMRYLEFLGLGGTSYPMMKLMRHIIFTPLPDDNGLPVETLNLFKQYIDLFHKEGAIHHLIDHGGKPHQKGFFVETAPDYNYILLFPPSERRGLIPLPFLGRMKEAPPPEFSSMILLPIDGVVHAVERIRGMGVYYGRVSGTFRIHLLDSPLVTHLYAEAKAMINSEEKGIYITSLPPKPNESGVVPDDMEYWAKESKISGYYYGGEDERLHSVPWITFLSGPFPTHPLEMKTISPMTTLEPSLFPTINTFRVAGVAIPSYPDVSRGRSQYMNTLLFLESKERSGSPPSTQRREMVSILASERKDIIPILYCWDYINGIDSNLDVQHMTPENIRGISRYFGYFGISYDTDLYGGYILSLLHSRGWSEGELIRFLSGEVGKITDRKEAFILRGNDDEGSPIDKLIASFGKRSLVTEIFTYPYYKEYDIVDDNVLPDVFVLYGITGVAGNYPYFILLKDGSGSLERTTGKIIYTWGKLYAIEVWKRQANGNLPLITDKFWGMGIRKR